MAFWGVEVKPGKPVTHSCEKSRGRLRISQATLGIGEVIKKTIVQCNVGKKSPVLLCVLLPNITESCHLDLEFAEADDVVFSVIGPRSVYLTGYYVSQSQPSDPHSDSESYGVDIQDSEAEGSSYCSDDDKYEDSFIDDGELQVSTPSPVPSTQGMDEAMAENNQVKGKKGRLKKKYQVVESDDDGANSCDSEDDNGFLLSIFKSKKAVKTSSDAGEKIDHKKSKKKDDPIHITDQQEGPKQKKKRKERSKEEKTSEVETDKDHNDLREDKDHQVEASMNLKVGDKNLSPSPESASGNSKKSKKRRKVQLANEDQEKQIDSDASMKPELLANGNQPKKKNKKKVKKKSQSEEDLNTGLRNTTDNQENKPMKFENQSTNAKPSPKRTLSNGLIIEEIANGPLEGKVAVPGKKVKIYYTAMLKENGHIFDSNVGKTACKFRLGDEEIIDGWNIGIDGMRVGDKRKLTIPPSMGFGKHGTGENVPPNSWLVYDVELVGVRK